MSINYLTNSSGFTRIAAYVGQLIDGAVDEFHRRALSTATSGSGEPMSQSTVRTERAYVADDRLIANRRPF